MKNNYFKIDENDALGSLKFVYWIVYQIQTHTAWSDWELSEACSQSHSTFATTERAKQRK